MWAYHVSKVIHAQAVGVFAQGVLQVVQLDLLQVLLPHHSPPALLFLKQKRKRNQESDFFPPLFKFGRPQQLTEEGVKKLIKHKSPHDISLYASSSTGPSGHPTVGPGWGLRGRH